MPSIHVRANEADPEIAKQRMPGEDLDAFTDRLARYRRFSGRFRQCSIGWHDECSDPYGQECTCKCHLGRRN